MFLSGHPCPKPYVGSGCHRLRRWEPAAINIWVVCCVLLGIFAPGTEGGRFEAVLFEKSSLRESRRFPALNRVLLLSRLRGVGFIRFGFENEQPFGRIF